MARGQRSACPGEEMKCCRAAAGAFALSNTLIFFSGAQLPVFNYSSILCPDFPDPFPAGWGLAPFPCSRSSGKQRSPHPPCVWPGKWQRKGGEEPGGPAAADTRYTSWPLPRHPVPVPAGVLRLAARTRGLWGVLAVMQNQHVEYF